MNVSAPGFQARVPDRGGCLQWSRIALTHYSLPADPVPSGTREPGPRASVSPSPEVPAGNGEVTTQHPDDIDADDLVGIAAAMILGTAASLWAALARLLVLCAALSALVPAAAPAGPQRRKTGPGARLMGPAHSRSVFSIRSEETAL